MVNVKYRDEITRIIHHKAKVIDIACGNGKLLSHMVESKDIDAHGIEIQSKNVADGLSNGLAIIQGDATTELQYYADNAFDYAILSMSLQVMGKPREVLKQAIRIAKYTIITMPNFGHIQNRLALMFSGKMPVTKQLSFEWYETPNIHFSTIADMVALVESVGGDIVTRRYQKSNGDIKDFKGYGYYSANIFARDGLIVVKNGSEGGI